MRGVCAAYARRLRSVCPGRLPRLRSDGPSPGNYRYPAAEGMDGHRISEMPAPGSLGAMTNYEYTFRLMTVRRLERELLQEM